MTDDQKAEADAANYNFDHPSAFDFDAVLEALMSIRQGAEVTQVPAYDYVTHSVMSEEHNSVIERPSVVIFEGILAFHDPAVMRRSRACTESCVSAHAEFFFFLFCAALTRCGPCST